MFLKIATACLDMSATMGDAFGAFKDAAGFLVSRPLPVLSDFAKVAALGLVIQFILSGITLLLATAMGVDLQGIAEPPLEFMAIAIVIAAPAVIVNAALNATPYHLVDERRQGRSGDIIRKTLGLIVPMGRYMLTVFAGFVALLAATLILGALGGILDPLVGVLGLLAGAIAMLIAFVAIQFAVPEIVLRGTGAIQSIKSSWAIVSANPVAIIAFDILMVAIAMFAILLFGSLGAMRTTAVTGDLIGMVYPMLLSLMTSMAMTMLTVMPFYFFWKKLAAPTEQAPMPKEAPKPVAKRKARRSKR